MRRHAALAALLLLLTGHAGDAAEARPAQRPDPAARQREFEAWWERQREREAADRFWNGPREQRRALTRDQFERWEQQRERRTGRPSWPY